MQKRVIITRLIDDCKQTLGDLQVFIGYQRDYCCVTLELANKDNQRNISCIPAGRYKVVRHKSPTKGDCYSVLDVPGRDNVLIHAGNYAASKNPKTGKPDTQGCILVGRDFAMLDNDDQLDVTHSKITLQRLFDACPDGFVLDIVDTVRVAA